MNEKEKLIPMAVAVADFPGCDELRRKHKSQKLDEARFLGD